MCWKQNHICSQPSVYRFHSFKSKLILYYIYNIIYKLFYIWFHQTLYRIGETYSWDISSYVLLVAHPVSQSQETLYPSYILLAAPAASMSNIYIQGSIERILFFQKKQSLNLNLESSCQVGFHHGERWFDIAFYDRFVDWHTALQRLQDELKTSLLLKKEDVTAWLAGITETEHDVNTIFILTDCTTTLPICFHSYPTSQGPWTSSCKCWQLAMCILWNLHDRQQEITRMPWSRCTPSLLTPPPATCIPSLLSSPPARLTPTTIISRTDMFTFLHHIKEVCIFTTRTHSPLFRTRCLVALVHLWS